MDAGKRAQLGERPFRFQGALLQHKSFMKIVEEKWVHGDVALALSKLTDDLSIWNKETFGNIFRRKRKLQSRQEGVQRALEKRTTGGLLKLECKLNKEWNEILEQEDPLDAKVSHFLAEIW